MGPCRSYCAVAVLSGTEMIFTVPALEYSLDVCMVPAYRHLGLLSNR